MDFLEKVVFFFFWLEIKAPTLPQDLLKRAGALFVPPLKSSYGSSLYVHLGHPNFVIYSLFYHPSKLVWVFDSVLA